MCLYTDKLYILIVKNKFILPSMTQNVLPLFVVRSYGVQANSTPNIQAKEPTSNGHSIYFCNDDFRIPLLLWGVFSYFTMLKPKKYILDKFYEVFLLNVYARNKDNMLISKVEIYSMIVAPTNISKIKSKFIDDIV